MGNSHMKTFALAGI